MKKIPPKILATATLIATLFALNLSGCGQRGPLYLPEPPKSLPKPLNLNH